MLNLHCVSSFDIGLFGSLYFFGILFGSIAFPSRADSIGRKPFIHASAIIESISFFVLLLSKSLYFHYPAIFTIGVSAAMKAMISIPHFMEFLTGKESFYGGVVFFA